MVSLTPLTSKNYTSTIFFLVFQRWRWWHEEKNFKRYTCLTADGVVDTVNIKKLIHQPFFFLFLADDSIDAFYIWKNYTSKFIWIKANLEFSPNTFCSNFDLNVVCIEISILCKFKCFELAPLTCWPFFLKFMCEFFPLIQVDMKL